MTNATLILLALATSGGWGDAMRLALPAVQLPAVAPRIEAPAPVEPAPQEAPRVSVLPDHPACPGCACGCTEGGPCTCSTMRPRTMPMPVPPTKMIPLPAPPAPAPKVKAAVYGPTYVTPILAAPQAPAYSYGYAVGQGVGACVNGQCGGGPMTYTPRRGLFGIFRR